MATDCRIAALEVTAVAQQPFPVRSPTAARDYWALTKPEINFLIAIATFAGFYLGCPAQLRAFPFTLLIHTLLGTLLVASGAGALNQYVERRFDRQMRRTARRPLAGGRLDPSFVLCFGILLSFAGVIYLAVAVGTLTSLLAALTLAGYLGLYTPLKRKTPLCTIAGALPGAMPPLIGCAAASGKLSFEAWVLYIMLFLWQFPHFMAIAWMYREDYARAGYLGRIGGPIVSRNFHIDSYAGLFFPDHGWSEGLEITREKVTTKSEWRTTTGSSTTEAQRAGSTAQTTDAALHKQ